MGWRSKIIFLMIVYFSGFATAIYTLAPSGGEQYYESSYDHGDKIHSSYETSGILDRAYNRACAKLGGMDTAEFKEKFNLGLQKLLEMVNTSTRQTEKQQE